MAVGDVKICNIALVLLTVAMGEPNVRFLRQMHEQLTCGRDLVWVNYGISQAFYKQKPLHFDLEE